MPIGRSTLTAMAVVAVSMYTATTTQAALIDMTLSHTEVNAGDYVTLDFSISGLSTDTHDSLGAFDFDILFDNNALTYIGADFSDPALGNPLDFAEPLSWSFYGDAQASGGTVDVFALSCNSAAILDSEQADSFRFLSLMF